MFEIKSFCIIAALHSNQNMFQPFHFFQTFPDGGQTCCCCGTKLFHPIILISRPVGPQWKKGRPDKFSTGGLSHAGGPRHRDLGDQRRRKTKGEERDAAEEARARTAQRDRPPPQQYNKRLFSRENKRWTRTK